MNHGRIQEYGHSQRESQNLDEHEVTEDERPEDHHHNGGGKRDDTAGAGKSLHQCCSVGEPGSPTVGNSSDDEHLVVHAQSKYDAKYYNRQYRKAAMHGTRKTYEPRPQPVLKYDGHGTVGGGPREQIQRHRLDGNEHAAKRERQYQERRADNAHDDGPQRALDGMFVIGVEA